LIRILEVNLVQLKAASTPSVMMKTPGRCFLVEENPLDLLDPLKTLLMLLSVVLPEEAGEEAPVQ
jgi:hypothetical protein